MESIRHEIDWGAIIIKENMYSNTLVNTVHDDTYKIITNLEGQVASKIRDIQIGVDDNIENK